MSRKPGRRDEVVAAFVRDLAPRIPPQDLTAVVDHALGSRGLKSAGPARAAWLSLVAFVRHVHTDYDALLDDGYDVDSARFFVADEMRAVLEGWGCRKPLDPGEDEDEPVPEDDA